MADSLCHSRLELTMSTELNAQRWSGVEQFGLGALVTWMRDPSRF